MKNRKILSSLSTPIIILVVILFNTIRDIGKSYPGYTVSWTHVLVLIFALGGSFYFGYKAHKDQVH